MLAFAAVHLLTLAVLAVTAWVAGRTATAGLGLEPGERGPLALAVGLVVLAQLALLLGLAGRLTAPAVLLAVAAVHAAGARAWRELWGGARHARAALDSRRLAVGLGLALALAPVAVLAVYPPTAFDATEYHLPVARAFARSGELPFLPDLRYPVFPHLGNVLFAALLLVGPDTGTHLVSLLATAATAALLLAWGRRAGRAGTGWLAAALYLGHPIVVHLAGTAYLDALFTLMVTAALYAAERYRESGRRGWLVVAAALVAAAADTKYQGLVPVVLVLALLVAGAPPGRWRRDLGVAALVVLAVTAPCYGRIAFLSGDPLFPFFLSRDGPWSMPYPGPGPAERALRLLTLPWDVVARRELVGRQPPFSPFLLLGLPLLLAAALRRGPGARLLGIALAYTVSLLVAPPDSRYLVAVVPVLSLVVALEVGRLLDRAAPARDARGRAAMAALGILVMAPGVFYAGYRLGRLGPLPTSPAARDRFLATTLPLYPAIRHLNVSRGGAYRLYAFHAENMRYFAAGEVVGDWNGPASFARMLPLAADPPALHAELLRHRVDHLLVPRASGPPLPRGDREFARRFEPVYEDAAAQLFALRRPPRPGW